MKYVPLAKLVRRASQSNTRTPQAHASTHDIGWSFLARLDIKTRTHFTHAAVLHVREARCNTAGWEAEVLVLFVCRALVLSCSNVDLTFLFGA